VVVCVCGVPRLSGRVRVVLRVVGFVLIVVAGVSFYLSHLYQSLSSRYNATTLCLGALSNLSKVPQLGRSAVIDIVGYYVGHYHVSMMVRVVAYNGTLLFSYGSYVPPAVSVAQMPTISESGVVPSMLIGGQVVIVGYGVCQYYGNGFMLEVKVGVLPETLYSFIIGIVLLILGLVLIAISG